LVDGFTAVAHAGDRIRRGQARPGEVLGVVEASLRYKLGRMQFERLLVRATEYLRGESLEELDEIGERLFAEQVVHKVYPLMRQIVDRLGLSPMDSALARQKVQGGGSIQA
jgi:phosphoserine phosphatase